MGTRSLDTSQDWHLILAEENTTHTVLDFFRKYTTCDSNNDLEIFENEWEHSNIIISYGFIDPEGVETIGEPEVENVFYQSLFRNDEIYEPKEKDVEVFDYWFNVMKYIENV